MSVRDEYENLKKSLELYKNGFIDEDSLRKIVNYNKSNSFIIGNLINSLSGYINCFGEKKDIKETCCFLINVLLEEKEIKYITSFLAMVNSSVVFLDVKKLQDIIILSGGNVMILKMLQKVLENRILCMESVYPKMVKLIKASLRRGKTSIGFASAIDSLIRIQSFREAIFSEDELIVDNFLNIDIFYTDGIEYYGNLLKMNEVLLDDVLHKTLYKAMLNSSLRTIVYESIFSSIRLEVFDIYKDAILSSKNLDVFFAKSVFNLTGNGCRFKNLFYKEKDLFKKSLDYMRYNKSADQLASILGLVNVVLDASLMRNLLELKPSALDTLEGFILKHKLMSKNDFDCIPEFVLELNNANEGSYIRIVLHYDEIIANKKVKHEEVVVSERALLLVELYEEFNKLNERDEFLEFYTEKVIPSNEKIYKLKSN